MHGGGNTSVKAPFKDIFGREIPALYVKGSGWDLASIEKEGFSPVRRRESSVRLQLKRAPWLRLRLIGAARWCSMAHAFPARLCRYTIEQALRAWQV